MATNAICYTFKADLLVAGHNFSAAQSGVAVTNTSGTNAYTIASTAGISVGAIVTGTGVQSNTIVATITGPTSFTTNTLSTANVSSIAIKGDPFYFALFSASPSLTYSGTQVSYGIGSGTPSTVNIGTDEATGTGYTAGGIALANVQPAISGTSVATTSFSPSPSLTSATISTSAALVYNSAKKIGLGVAQVSYGRAVGIYDFGGVQTVSNGTITFTMPVNSAGTALIQIT